MKSKKEIVNQIHEELKKENKYISKKVIESILNIDRKEIQKDVLKIIDEYGEIIFLGIGMLLVIFEIIILYGGHLT